MNGVDQDYSTTSYTEQEAVERQPNLTHIFALALRAFTDTQQRRIYNVFCYIQRNLCR